MLKALELTGFKSFAEKTRFEFHQGVTVVVGPNGSGKSNVVDAIKWVLGSQSAKSLRGSEMTDVIFNGSGSRGALHTAEVTLVLDNSEGRYGSGSRLGRDALEIAITRRVYRSGEGEYLINGTACRLRDIRDLLAGTGIGTEAYSIIEQGKVDALLQASPKDRRAIFEEAAGISRFRTKRQEASRRLARVEQNLLRLSDIVDEVESQLRSVRMQAGKAQRYREGTRRLKDLRTQIGIADWSQLSGRLSSLTAELQQFQQQHEGRRESIASAEQEMPQTEQALQQAQAECEKIEQRLATLRESRIARQATETGLLGRQQDLEANHDRLQQQWLAARPVESPPQPDNKAIELRLQAAQVEYDDATRRLASATERQQQLTTAVTRGKAQLADLHRRLADIERREALARQEWKLLSQQQSQSPQEQRELQAEAESIDQQLQSLTTQLSTAQTEEQETNHLCEKSGQQLEAAQAEQSANQSRLVAVQRESQQIESQLSLLRHRIELLGELDRERHEMQNRVREFVELTTGGQATQVADLLHVDADTAPIIEAALGGLAESFVLPRTESLLQATSPLPEGAHLLRLDWQPAANAIDRIDLNEQSGVWGRADQFVDSEPEYASLVRRLLGRTWIVDTLATAVGLASSAGYGLHFVTADGDFLSAEGTLRTGGRQQMRGAVTRRNQLEQLNLQVKQLTPKAADLLQQLQAKEAEVPADQKRVAATLSHHRTALEKQADARQQVATLASRNQPLAERAEVIARKRERMGKKRASLDSERKKHETQLATLVGHREQLASTCETIATQLAEAESQATTAREVASRNEVAVAKLEHQIEALAATVSVQQAAPRVPEMRQQLASQIKAVAQRIEQVQLERLACHNELATLAWQRQQLLPLRAKAANCRVQLQQRRETLGKQLQQARRKIDETQSQQAQLELSVARIKDKRQSLADRLHDDYEIDLPKVAAAAPPQPSEINRKQVEREINQLREGLHRIGSVNVDALEELEAIESRFEAISAQYNDLSQAKTSLERLMAKLNTESRQIFLETVDTVRGHFQELYRRLFGGGEADIVLEDYESDDALECGVEIHASPPGKETRTISLLSGGEKTMTCVALLLAMFRSKPSPFCVLDEVDAALDEANVGRFTNVLSDFLTSTQFIVITHSKKTMTGANTLYGVTMQESGISKLVSVRFDDVTEDGFIKPKPARNEDDTPPLARAA